MYKYQIRNLQKSPQFLKLESADFNINLFKKIREISIGNYLY